MSGKGLSPAQFNAPPMIVQDADPLRFRVGEQDPKTREFAAFIGDHHRYFAAAAAAAAANPHPHLEFRQNFYSEKPISVNPNDSGGSDGEDDVDVEEEDEDDDIEGNEGDVGMNKDGGEDSVSAGAGKRL